ncbi:MAG: hypothetical protein EOM40_12355 [Clostridia bacterium]|nr:hypothetical protein [Clostridia bacterium]
MAKYTGRRIVPKHAGEWNIRKEYEELQIVLDTESGNSYISNLPVPKGTALTDEKYWSLYSLYSEQIAEAEEHLTQTAGDIRTELSETEDRINESLSSTENKVNTNLSETENRVTARVENAKSDLTAKVMAAEQQMNQSVQNIEQTNKTLNARMDQIAKGKTSDTEVLDARVDAEGNTFDSLGAAIRSIYPKAKAGLDALEETKLDANYDATGELTEGITVNTINGGIQNFEHVRTTAMIPVDSACQKIYYTGQVFNWIGIAGYDATGVFVASILDSRDTEQPREYKEKELEIPEGVYQIRASSYYQDMKLEVRGDSAKLWNQIQQERQNQKKMAIEIEALRSADDSLAKETMTSLELPFLYENSSNIWEGSNPVLQTYYVPLTVLRSVFVQEIHFTLRTIGATSLTSMIESDDGEVFRQTVELVKGDNKITLTLHQFLDAGIYKFRVRSTDKVLYYPVRPTNGKEIRNEFFSNEPSGNVDYDYKNRLIVFMGKILVGTGKVDETLSHSGMAADAAVVGQAFEDEREYTDTVAAGKLDAVRSRNLLDPSKYRPGWFAYVHSSVIAYHPDNLRYGSTDYIPVSENGLVTKGSGTNGVTSQVVFDKAKKVLRYVDANDQYTYQEGDAYVMFFYMASSGQGLCIVEGTEYVYEAYTDYKPLDDLKKEVKSLQTAADEQQKQLTSLTARLDGPEKKALRLIPAAPVYTVCNDLSTARNYHVSVWVDHLIADTGWKDKAAGFGTEMEQSFDLYSPFTNTAVNGGEDVLEQTVEKSFVSDAYQTQKLTFKHRSTLASMGKTQFPKILVIGDSVTDGYLAGVGKTDADLPTHYWAWVRYLFELDRKDAKAAENEYRCLMLGMPGTVNGKHYGSSSSFKLDGKSIVNYAMGKGGWSAEDLNLASFESASNVNPFYDEKTKGFSLKACLDKYRTLADNGMTRLIPGETAGTEVKDANAYDLCTPTHVVINLNHNSSLAEYKANIPDIVKTIKREYPDIIVILMSIDETGTYFPAKYPEYRASEITLGGLHSKNMSIYQYFCDELQDEANGIYVCSGHLIQPAVESYPTLDYVSADSVGRQSGKVLHMAYGRGQYGRPNWHPNNYAHCAWGYQLYALVKYTLAIQDMK